MYADAPGGVNPFSLFCLRCLEPTSTSSEVERQLLLRWLRPGPSSDALAGASMAPQVAIDAMMASTSSMLPIPDLEPLRQSVAERMPAPMPTAAASVRPVVLDPEGQTALLAREQVARTLREAAAAVATGPGASAEAKEAAAASRRAVLGLHGMDAGAAQALAAEPPAGASAADV